MKTQLCREALSRIREKYEVAENNIGKDRHLSRGGLHFAVHSYEIGGVGHLCAMTMNALCGLMKMETVVIAPTEKDLPLFNIDRVDAFGKETLIIEIYDTQLEPLSDEVLGRFEVLLNRDSDIPDIETKPHWYDEIRYPVSYGKAGKKFSGRFQKAQFDYLEIFLDVLERAPGCDREMKAEKNREFAEKLVANSGPAVDTMRSRFGEETMRRVVLTHMYGVRQNESAVDEGGI